MTDINGHLRTPGTIVWHVLASSRERELHRRHRVYKDQPILSVFYRLSRWHFRLCDLLGNGKPARNSAIRNSAKMDNVIFGVVDALDSGPERGVEDCVRHGSNSSSAAGD